MIKTGTLGNISWKEMRNEIFHFVLDLKSVQLQV